MSLGFTGTQWGMSQKQIEAFTALIRNRWPPGEFRHGDCDGADATAHGIATAFGWHVIIHPPTSNSRRAFCPAPVILPPEPYLVRNHKIVDATKELVATPYTMQEELRSGTWATVRYARKLGRLITIIYPDGSLEFAP